MIKKTLEKLDMYLMKTQISFEIRKEKKKSYLYLMEIQISFEFQKKIIFVFNETN